MRWHRSFPRDLSRLSTLERILTCLGATGYTAMAILHIVLIASSGMISALIDTAIEAARAVALFGVAVLRLVT